MRFKISFFFFIFFTNPKNLVVIKKEWDLAIPLNDFRVNPKDLVVSHPVHHLVSNHFDKDDSGEVL
jgi:hypothetical protein